MVRELSQSELQKFNTEQGDIIQNIQDIQNIEIGLYKDLEANVSSNGTTAERDIYLARIEKLSEIRMDMYRTIMDNYEEIRKSINTTSSELTEKLMLIDIVQQQLDSLRRQTSELNQEKTGKKRMIEINNYYGKKYMAQKELMQIIILTSVPLLILSLLTKFGTLASTLARMIGAVVLIIGLYFIIRKYIDIKSRTHYNFDEYDWGYKPPSLPSTFELEPDAEKADMSLSMGGCIGQACCTEGMVYDKIINKCITQSQKDAQNAKQN